jgi:hypothetical protein
MASRRRREALRLQDAQAAAAAPATAPPEATAAADAAGQPMHVKIPKKVWKNDYNFKRV